MARYLVTGEFVDPEHYYRPNNLHSSSKSWYSQALKRWQNWKRKRRYWVADFSPVLGLVPSSSTWLPTVRSIKYYKGYPSGAWSSGLSLLCKNIGSGQPMRKRPSNR